MKPITPQEWPEVKEIVDYLGTPPPAAAKAPPKAPATTPFAEDKDGGMEEIKMGPGRVQYRHKHHHRRHPY